MNEFERQLRRELQGFDVPPGLTGRVMKSLERKKHQARVSLWQRAIAAAVLFAVGMGVWGAQHYQAEQRTKATRLRHEFTLAMQVTAKSLNAAAASLQQIQTNGSLKEENQ